MARDFATIQTSIWGNPDVRALPLEHQGLYLQLWTHPDLNRVGVLDWRPAKNIAPLSLGSTAESIRELIPLLERRLFVILDEDTEELLVRSYMRHDGLLKNPKTAVSMAIAYAGTGSNMLRQVIVHELLRLRDEFPDWAAWRYPKVLDVLKHPALDPRSLVPALPQGLGEVLPLALPEGLPLTQGEGLGVPHTATTTSTEASLLGDDDLEDESGPKRTETRLPKSWAPTPSHFTLARTLGVDIAREVDAFRGHAETHDRHAARWNAAFTTWLKKARPTVGEVPTPGNEWMYR